MVQIIEQQGSIAGRLGRAVGKGLSEQLPKEVDRYRLSQGLENFQKEANNLTPLEQYTRLAAIPGITPSMMQALPEILKQQNYNKAFNQTGQQEETNKNENPFQRPSTPQEQPGGKRSITTPETTKATIENYIPKSRDQLLDRAGQLYNENPGLFKNDPQNAIQAAREEDQQNQSINTAKQNQRNTQQDVQSRVQNELRSQSSAAGVQIPDNVYKNLEDEAIEAVNSGKMTEQEAGRHFSKEADKISREYQSLKTLGKVGILTKSASSNKASLRSLQEKFKERNDLENLADTYISQNGLSPGKAYYLAYPVSDTKELNNEIMKLPKIQQEFSHTGYRIPEEKSRSETLKIAPILAKKMGNTGSPLAVAEELKSRGYDPDVWLDYLQKNQKKLDLKERQGRELDKPRPGLVPNLNDLWMFTFSGLDNLLEQ